MAVRRARADTRTVVATVASGVDDNTETSDFHVVTRGMLDAQNYKSLSRQTPLTPGEFYQLTWKLLPLDYELKAGHRLGLVLTGTNDDFDRNVAGDGTDDDVEPGTGATVTIDLALARRLRRHWSPVRLPSNSEIHICVRSRPAGRVLGSRQERR